MRTVDESRKEIERLDKEIEDVEERIRIIKEHLVRLHGIKAGILWTLTNKKKGETP